MAKKTYLNKKYFFELNRGLGTEYCYEKNPQNSLGTVSVIPQNGIPSCFSFAEGSDRNYESLLLFLFHKTEFRVVVRNGIPSCFLFRRRVRNGIPSFLFLGTAEIPSEITICSVYSVFRGIIFLLEIPNSFLPPNNTELRRFFGRFRSQRRKEVEDREPHKSVQL